MIVPLPRLAAHPDDRDAIDDHVTGMAHVPHQHVVREDWQFEKRQRVAMHIDRWHHSSEGDWRDTKCPARGPALSHYAPELDPCHHCGWDGWPPAPPESWRNDRG